MREEYSSSLSIRRILISLAIFAMIPLLSRFLNQYILNETLCTMFALNLGAAALIMYDWNLFGLHWNRFKNHLAESLLWAVIGFAALGLWFFFNQRLLHGSVLLPDKDTLARYPLAVPVILAAFSFSQSAVVNMTFKCLTDHFKIQTQEAVVILMSGFLFGLCFTLAEVSYPISLTVFVPGYFYNVVLVTILSYLYNQSGNLMPGILSMGTVYLILCIQLML